MNILTVRWRSFIPGGASKYPSGLRANHKCCRILTVKRQAGNAYFLVTSTLSTQMTWQALCEQNKPKKLYKIYFISGQLFSKVHRKR